MWPYFQNYKKHHLIWGVAVYLLYLSLRGRGNQCDLHPKDIPGTVCLIPRLFVFIWSVEVTIMERITLFLYAVQLSSVFAKLCSTMNDDGDGDFFHTGSDLLFSVLSHILVLLFFVFFCLCVHINSHLTFLLLRIQLHFIKTEFLRNVDYTISILYL